MAALDRRIMNRLDALNYYTATKKYDLAFPRLTQDIDADVVVIGGGFSGINTALELAEKGITDVVVLEAKHLGYGGTGRNGGQVMAGIGHDLNAVKKHVGPEGLETLFKIANLGAGIIRERIEKYGINADFCQGYGYLAYNERQVKTLRTWEKEFSAVDPDEDIELLTGAAVSSVIGSDVYAGVLKHMGGGHVHSLNLLLGEAQALASHGARIFENSPVISVEYGDRITVRTNAGKVTASKLLWACDSFLNKLEPSIYGKTINTYAFQIATEPLSDALIERISGAGLLRGGSIAAVASGALALGLVAAEAMTAIALVVAMGLFAVALALIYAVAPLQALASTKAATGMAASWRGFLEMSGAMIGSAGVTVLHDGTPWPLAIVLAAAAVVIVAGDVGARRFAPKRASVAVTPS